MPLAVSLLIAFREFFQAFEIAGAGRCLVFGLGKSLEAHESGAFSILGCVRHRKTAD